MPDPLDPSHIPGQNRNTRQRLPGHTRWYEFARPHFWKAALIAGCLILVYALLLAGAIWSDQGKRKNEAPTQSGANIENR